MKCRKKTEYYCCQYNGSNADEVVSLIKEHQGKTLIYKERDNTLYIYRTFPPREYTECIMVMKVDEYVVVSKDELDLFDKYNFVEIYEIVEDEQYPTYEDYCAEQGINDYKNGYYD